MKTVLLPQAGVGFKSRKKNNHKTQFAIVCLKIEETVTEDFYTRFLSAESPGLIISMNQLHLQTLRVLAQCFDMVRPVHFGFRQCGLCCTRV